MLSGNIFLRFSFIRRPELVCSNCKMILSSAVTLGNSYFCLFAKLLTTKNPFSAIHFGHNFVAIWFLLFSSNLQTRATIIFKT